MDDLCPDALWGEELNGAHVRHNFAPTWPKFECHFISAAMQIVSRTGHIDFNKGCGTLPTPLA